MTNIFDEEIFKLIREHNILDEKLTENQMAEALKQALACGDFVRNIHLSRSGSYQSNVTYIPYREVERLKSQIKRLNDALSKIKDIIKNLEQKTL